MIQNCFNIGTTNLEINTLLVPAAFDKLLSSDIFLMWQDDSDDTETDGDEEDSSQSSMKLQAASRFHR